MVESVDVGRGACRIAALPPWGCGSEKGLDFPVLLQPHLQKEHNYDSSLIGLSRREE